MRRSLYSRGFTDPQSARAFLRGEMTFPDPFKMAGMQDAVRRIRRAIKNSRSLFTATLMRMA
ncbi:MAG: hypothetical protein U0528_12920 [Anaerolineae bacterium]